MDIDKLIKIGLTLSSATNLDAFFSRNAYIADFEESDMVPGFAMPKDKYLEINLSALKQFLKADTQYYRDIDTLLAQNGNSKPNQGGVSSVIVFQKTDEADFGEAFDKLMSINANFAQLAISSREVTEIEKVADKLATARRLFEAQTSSETISTKAEANIAKKLADKNNDWVKITFHKVDSEAAAMGIMAIQTGEKLGGKGDVFSKITNVSSQSYTPTEEANFEALNVSYYTPVNPINGGGVDQYATNIYTGGKMINGENAKRRRIRYYLDLTMKACSLDFLAKKLDYDDVGGAVLESMLAAIFIEGQQSDVGLIARDTEDSKGFVLDVLSMEDTKRLYNSFYKARVYKVGGWYIDRLTGERVDIDLLVDPSDAEKLKL